MATFVRVADAASLSKAARVLGVSPAAVSRQLTALEEELGVQLLVRTTRRLTITEPGRRFYEHAARTVADAEEARVSVRPDHAVSGLVALSVPTALGAGRLAGALATLPLAHPGLRIDLRLEDHPIDLLAEGVDIAVRAGLVPPNTTTLVAHPIGEGERVIVAAPSYLRRRGEPAEPADLSRHDAVVHAHAGANVGVWTLRSGTRSITVEVRGAFRANALVALREAAIEGAGIALLPHFVVRDALEARRLRVLPLAGWRPEPQAIYALVRAEVRARTRTRVVLDHLREQLKANIR
jgi:DNA-binding transcriptional LysR family regulator